MAYVIAEPCIGIKEKERVCVYACPADCIYESEDQLFVNPDECSDCGACFYDCPVKAIFHEDEPPESWKWYREKNADFFN